MEQIKKLRLQSCNLIAWLVSTHSESNRVWVRSSVQWGAGAVPRHTDFAGKV